MSGLIQEGDIAGMAGREVKGAEPRAQSNGGCVVRW